MAQEYSISPADLSTIERNLRAVGDHLEVVESNIATVNDNVKSVYDDLSALTQEFREYVEQAERQHNCEVAEVRLVQVRQKLETKFGHYGEIRRTMTGILQADDLGIVKKETITNMGEEKMLSAPGYWLAPCLVALAAWINDQPEIADRALREAIKRDDEKTSLLFALICRRAGRKSSCLKWTKRYLENQDEEHLDRKCIIILDAFASGLLGADSEGVVEAQITRWLDHLEAKPGFVEQQRDQWATAIWAKRKPLEDTDYTYLKKYSDTWPILEEIMEGARLHGEMFDYLYAIFDQPVSTDSVKEQLDAVVTSLATDFDDEETPLRKEERLNEFIIQYQGDMKKANASMQVEQSAFEAQKDFTQLLTDAAMKPESTHASVSIQKFALALSREWVYDAYQDVVAANRMKIPQEIEIHVGSFKDKTVDGENEGELLAKFNRQIDQEKADALSKVVVSMFDQFCFFGGIGVVLLGLISLLQGSAVMGFLIAICGGGMLFHYFSKKKSVGQQRANVEARYEQIREQNAQILRATLAEVVDFRIDFAEKDQESEKVLDFLEGLSSEQFVQKSAESQRRIQVNG